MKATLARFIAAALLVIPGITATYGFLAMKDALFAGFGPTNVEWSKFFLGLVLFAVGVGFIGGWIFYRDRKRNYVAPRFKAKRRR